MSEKRPFSIEVNSLRRRAKDHSSEALEKADQAGESHGFVERAPKKKRGRAPSPRTGQVHAKVLPRVAADISAEAKRQGVQQGVLIEEAWALYCERHGITRDE